MDSKLHELISRYDIKTIEDKKNAIKEILQEIVLVGLSKAGFFDKAAFYGGTALRIFYKLDRFSEDLDFSLLKTDKDFNFDVYIPVLNDVAKKYGLNVEISSKEKIKETNIKSAFLKGNTIQILTLLFNGGDISQVNPDEKVKIKFEVDTTPPVKATYETRYCLSPEPYMINLFDKESLFSGKLHAIICRRWKNRVKGRDLYDYVFYLQHNIKFNLDHLRERLIESNFIDRNCVFNLEFVKETLKKRFDEINFNEAKGDVLPFIKDKESLKIWSKDFFVSITEYLDCI